MILCLDIGNTHIFGGLMQDNTILLRFRYPSDHTMTSDVLGLFLRDVIQANQFDPSAVNGVSICSVVPALDYTVRAACRKYFKLSPLFLKPGVKTGLKLGIKNPLELGADRIANAIAAIERYPKRHLIVVDYGTATTVCVINKHNTYLGGAILPGFKLSMESLSQKAAKLSAVDILKPDNALGKTTATNIQAGLYFGQLGATKEIIAQLNATVFTDEAPIVISTGGYAHLLQSEQLFTENLPDLVLDGLYLVWQKNQSLLKQ